jgi:class 3 adenylate cyclase/tetratricopeptide (TPR) repeat protein
MEADGLAMQSNGQVATVLFTDVEGSTELRSRHGDAGADRILGLHERLVREQIERHGGEEVAFLGDGFMASFGSPVDAVRAAVAIERGLEDHNRDRPEEAVRVRVGMHAGPVTARDGTLYGQTVHAASRVTFEAAGGQILVSPSVHDQVAGSVDVDLRDRGLFWLKGFPERWRLYEVEWRRGAEGVDLRRAGGAVRTPFVGREGERADLRRAVDAALTGEGSLVLLAGEAGVGKSRLTLEVQAEAEARGMRILVGHCSEMEHAPYLPFVEILEAALVSSRSPEALRQALGEGGPEVARIVPGLRRVLPDLPPPVDLPAEQARRYLWLSVHEFVERASRQRPLMLVLEDLHWADESTLLLLEYLTPQLPDMPVVVVGTYRDVEVGVTHPLNRIVSPLARRGLLTRISLGRLPEDDVAAMIGGLAGTEPPPGLVRAIHAESEGNPFFVEEVFLHLEESGQLLDDRGRFRTDLTIDELDVPESIRLVVGERLARLSEPTREALTAAAVIGRVFGAELVERMSELSRDAVLDALDEAERARLIGPDDARSSRLAFAHELIRQTLLTDTSSVRRRRLHARAAEAIEAVHADDLESHAADLAYHLSRSGPVPDPARLVRYLRIAGDRALQAAAFQDAVGHLEHALELLGPDDDAGTAEVLERLAMALRSVGRWDDALRTMDRALELYEGLGLTEALARLTWAMVYQLTWAGRMQEAVIVAARGLGALGELENPDRARVLSASGWALGLGGDHEGSNEMLDQARELAERLGDDRALADVLHMQTINHMGFAEFPQGVEAGMRAAKVFEAEGALWDLCSVLSFVLFQQGTLTPDPDGAPARGTDVDPVALVGRVQALATRLGHLGAYFMLLSHRARTDGVMAGDTAATAAIGREQVEVCERAGLPWLYVGHMYQGLAAHWRGDWEEAERELRLAVQLEPPAAFAGQSASLLAMHLAYAGRRDEALALVEAGAGSMAAPGRVNTLGQWNSAFAFTEVLATIGESERAAAMAPLIDEALALGHEWITFDCRTLRTRAGIAAAAGHRWDDAEAHYEAALAIARATSNRLEEADVLRLQAVTTIERDGPGDPERARDLAKHALAAYREMGMPKLEAEAAAILDGLG